MSHIFISYSHTDSEYAHQLARALEYNGFMVWIDERVDYGMQWPRVIQDNLDKCSAFVVIMTPRSYSSDWVQSELSRAKRKNKPMFPILLEGDEPWLSVETTQFIQVEEGQLPPQRFYDNIAAVAPRTGEIKELVPERKFELPLLEWCNVPAGSVVIEGKYYEVPAFRMSKYPVTTEQFAAFIDAEDGWTNLMWWGYSQYARRWHEEENPAPSVSTFPGKERPRETVAWFDAVAFSRWLGYKLQVSVNLPTEQQWQRAAQGNGSHEYPWGNNFDKTRCNTWESKINETTPVYRYDNGVGDFGTFDMAGNVWEWCLSEFVKPDTSSLLTAATRTLRGGSWGTPRAEARTSYRFHAPPNYNSLLIGFRLVMPETK